MNDDEYSHRFETVCDRLRRNDPTLTFVHLDWLYPIGYAPILGEALMHRNNTMVSTLGIDISRLYYDHPSDPSNINNNHDNNQDGAGDSESGTEPLLQYIRTSISLQTVSIVATERVQSTNAAQKQRIAIHELIEAIVMSPSIVEIDFQRFKLPSSALLRLLQSTTTLTSFTLDLNNLHLEDDVAELSTMMRQSFGSNATLRRLALLITMDEGDLFQHLMDLFHHILQSLQTHPQLQELSIEVRDGISDAHVIPILVSQFLLPHNRSLQKLELIRVEFQPEYLSHLLLVGVNPNPQLTTLAFRGCFFNEDATQMLLDYFQRADNASGCCVKHLHFDLHDTIYLDVFVPDTISFANRTDGQFFAALVSTRLPSRQHQLSELQMRDCTEFFKVLNAAAKGEYRLPRCLRLANLRASAWEQIQQYLVNHAIDLQELVVRGPIAASIQSRAIVNTIRRNGSLQSLTMQRKPEHVAVMLMDHCATPINIFGPVELHFINAYCQRNQQMSKKFSILSSNGSSSLLLNSNHANHSGEMVLCMVPTYIYVVRDARRMAPTTILQMVMAMDMSLGAQENALSSTTNLCKKLRRE